MTQIGQVAAGALLGAYTLYSFANGGQKQGGSTKATISAPELSGYEEKRSEYVNLEDKLDVASVTSSESRLSKLSRVSMQVDSVPSSPMKDIDEAYITLSASTSQLQEVNTEKQLLSSLEDMFAVSKKHSDLVFDFTTTSQTEEARGSNVIAVENRVGSGSVVVGAASGVDGKPCSRVSVLMTADALHYNVGTIYQLSAFNLPVVWHMACSGVDLDSLKLFSDYSALIPLLTSRFVVLTPSTAQEVHDFAVLAHHISTAAKVPVANCFDGFLGTTQKTTIEKESTSAVASFQSNSSVEDVLGTFHFKKFEYVGSQHASSVIVVCGSPAPAFIDYVKDLCGQNGEEGRFSSELGVLAVKMLRPFSDAEFWSLIPRTAHRISVIDFTPNGSNSLFRDVAGSLHGKEARDIVFNEFNYPSLISVKINSRDTVEVTPELVSLVVSNALSAHPQRKLVLNSKHLEELKERFNLFRFPSFSAEKKVDAHVVVWSRLEGTEQPRLRTQGLTGLFPYVQLSEQVDKYNQLVRTEIRGGSSKISCAPMGLAEVVVAPELTKLVAESVQHDGSIIITGTSSSVDLSEVAEDLRTLLSQKSCKIFQTNAGGDLTSQVQLALEVGAQNYSRVEEVERLALYRRMSFGSLSSKKVRVQQDSDEAEFFPRYQCPSIQKKEHFHEEAQGTGVVPSYHLAWNLLFNESFQSQKVLRPSEHEVGTATVTKFERLTPDEYNRNIFHIEFDISNTDIKYEIGDALGIFGENDPVKVKAFIEQYGLNANEIVKLPARGRMADDTCEYMSVHNLLLKNLDLFGKVQKKFYSELAQFATSQYEYLKLMHTGTDDAEQFKLGTYETVTYAELLLQYKSCKLTISDMIKLIPEVKARHYSISSSMKMNPRSVHLLVVAVDWLTPKGKFGEGQCTRYLKELRIGQRVTVDIQKSVLRLPPNPKQPIVMAGLGTGMAPFRAFIQQRYWLKRAGHEVGPMVLYFGARHKNQEWLYGEELEKYEEMGLLRLGLAWSRDQKNKVYIQHKIKEDAKLLKKYLKDQKGYFYLCGPTWPVPDVRNAIAAGIDEANAGKEDAELDVATVEEMKEEGRYILEVY